MSQRLCDEVVERIALGEPLAELATHTEDCERCARVVALPVRLAATHHAADPGLGFTARMTVAARQRIAVRHRRRVAGGLAATVVAGLFGVVVVTRTPDAPTRDGEVAVEPTPPPAPDRADPAVAVESADLEMLVQLADTKRARRLSAPWRRIQRPLKPYMQLVKGVTQ